jgi:RecA/RadA recombinase
LLRDFGPQLRRGHAQAAAEQTTVSAAKQATVSAGEPSIHLATGIADIDRLLGGGFPRGQLSEIAGPPSSGRTSLALALLAQSTRAGEVAAVVDGADAFDPDSAHGAGTLLDRVLWVRGQATQSAARAPRCLEVLRSAERILEAHGFALVLLDLTIPNLRVAPATGPRLARVAASTGAALIIMTRARAMGSAAKVAIELTPVRAHFTGTPALLEGLEIQATLVRHRSAPSPRTTTVQLRTPQSSA